MSVAAYGGHDRIGHQPEVGREQSTSRRWHLDPRRRGSSGRQGASLPSGRNHRVRRLARPPIRPWQVRAHRLRRRADHPPRRLPRWPDRRPRRAERVRGARPPREPARPAAAVDRATIVLAVDDRRRDGVRVAGVLRRRAGHADRDRTGARRCARPKPHQRSPSPCSASHGEPRRRRSPTWLRGPTTRSACPPAQRTTSTSPSATPSRSPGRPTGSPPSAETPGTATPPSSRSPRRRGRSTDRRLGGDGEATVLAVSGTPDWGSTADRTRTVAVSPLASLTALETFKSEVGSLALMIVMLFGVSALVVGAFFTVWTMQRAGDIAVLKALGASDASLVGDALGQALVVLAVGIGVGIGLVVGPRGARRRCPAVPAQPAHHAPAGGRDGRPRPRRRRRRTPYRHQGRPPHRTREQPMITLDDVTLTFPDGDSRITAVDRVSPAPRRAGSSPGITGPVRLREVVTPRRRGDPDPARTPGACGSTTSTRRP